MPKRSPSKPLSPDLMLLIDEAASTRRHRMEIEKKLAEWKQAEETVKQRVIAALLEAKLESAKTKTTTATLGHTMVGTVQSWPKLYQYIKKTGAFELLHKRLTNEAARERWEHGEKIPGVVPEKITKVTITGKGE